MPEETHLLRSESSKAVLCLLPALREAPVVDYRPGALCPKCRQAILDYDGMLNLVCPNCGIIQGGSFT